MSHQKEFALHTCKKRPYFEGWYIRGMQVDVSFIVIIGLHYEQDRMYATIQYADSNSKQPLYEVFEEKEIHIQEQPFVVKIKESRLTIDHLSLQLSTLCANLSFTGITSLSTSLYSPTIMGPFTYIPMACSHSIISLQHSIMGSIAFAQHTYTIHGVGYIEKDRGTSFPTKYLWLQANHYDQNDSIFLSIARIPFCKLHFMGSIAILMIKKKQFRFASYLGARITKNASYTKEGRRHILLTIKQFSY